MQDNTVHFCYRKSHRTRDAESSIETEADTGKAFSTFPNSATRLGTERNLSLCGCEYERIFLLMWDNVNAIEAVPSIEAPTTRVHAMNHPNR